MTAPRTFKPRYTERKLLNCRAERFTSSNKTQSSLQPTTMTHKPLAAPRLFDPNLAQVPPVLTADYARCKKRSSERVNHSSRIGTIVEPSCLVVDSTNVDGKPRLVLMESKCGQVIANTCSGYNLPTRTGVYFNDVELRSAIHPLQQCTSKLTTTKSPSLRAYSTEGAMCPLGRPLRAAPALCTPRLFSRQMPRQSRQPKRSSSSEIHGNIERKRHDSSEPRKEFPTAFTAAPELSRERRSKTSIPASVEASVVIEAAIALAKLGGQRES